MPISPIQNSSDIVSFTIYSEGRSITDTIEVTSIYISQKAGTADEAIISIRDGSSENNFLFEVTDSKTFKIGSHIKIKLGYNSINKTIFEGTVSEQNISISKGESFLKIKCHNANNIREQLFDFTQDPVLKVSYGEDIIDANLSITEQNDTNLSIINGNLTFQGTELAKLNDTIYINNLGQRFSVNSIAYISGVRHNMKDGNWITKVYLGVND